MTTRHHPDCDGYHRTHTAKVVHVSREGRGMWQAVAVECCDFAGTLVGPDAKSLARDEAVEHFAEVPCNGRCRSWEA